FVIRLYDHESTRTRVRKILGYEFDGSYMVIGFDGDPDIAKLQQQKALDICFELGAEDLGEEPGEKWWNHRYDFYYPPINLKLPWMYGTTETVTTYDKIQGVYYAIKEAVEGGFMEWNVWWDGQFSIRFNWAEKLDLRITVVDPLKSAPEA